MDTSNKRPNDDDVDINQEPQKRNRLECVEPLNEIQSTKFMDLKSLEKMCEYLDLGSLLNVASSNQRLRISARSVYSRKFGTQTVRIDFRFDIEFGFLYIDLRGKIQLDNAKMCFQFLRRLGPSIVKLVLHYHQLNIKYYDHQYINKYCADSLVSIEYRDKPGFSEDSFQKLFTTVENIQTWNCDLGPKFPSLPKWFPNLRRMDSLCAPVIDRRFIDATFHR